MKAALIILVGMIFFLSTSLPAREYIFGGRVCDSQSGLPLVGADVYLARSGGGTVTASNGWFSLKIDREDLQDTLIINYLGYQEKRFPLSTFPEGSLIRLEPKSLEFGERIEVSAERIDLLKQDIPHARHTVDFQEIRQYGGNEISDILKTVPAVQMEGNDLDGRRIQIRGSDPDEVKVYLDGVLINNARFDNAADFSIIPLESIDNLEILKGGNLVFLGNGAFGGVVNITTRQSSERNFLVKGKYGSSDNRILLAEFDFPLHRRLTMNYYTQLSKWAPEIEFYPGERFSEKSQASEIITTKQNHILNFNYFLSNGSFNAKFIGYFLKYDKIQWVSHYQNFMNVVSYKGEIFHQKDFEITVSHLHNRDKIERNPAGSTRFINHYQSNQLDARLTKKMLFRNLELQFLGEYFHEDLQADSKINNLEQENTFYSAFLYDNRLSVAGVFSFEDRLKHLPTLSWKTFLGTRGDFLASGTTDWTHMIGAQLNYRIEHWNLSPFFNWGTNVKYPTLEESAYFQDVIDFTRSDSLADRLMPEYDHSAEIGGTAIFYPSRAIFQNAEFSVSLFTRTVYNKLLRRPFDDVILATQLGRSLTRGAEASFSLRGIFNRASLSTSYIQLKISDPLLYAYKPDRKLSVHLLYPSNTGIYCMTTLFYEGNSVGWFYDSNDEFQTLQIPSYFDMDASLGIRGSVKGAEIDLQFSAHNIFDNSGFTYYYLKKRYLQISLSLRGG